MSEAIPKVKITAHELKRELRTSLERVRNGNAAKWAVFDELRLGTGFSTTRYLYPDSTVERDRRESRIDMFAICTWPSSGYERRAYEIKVDRQDLRNELANPDKRAPWLEVVNGFYLVIPKGLATVAEIAEQAPECGVITYTPMPERPNLRLCTCADKPRAPWLHAFDCPYKAPAEAYEKAGRGRRINTARPAMKLDGCEPSWGLVASILRSAAR